MSREQVLDAINDLFGRSKTPVPNGNEKKPISIHMFNNRLCKPEDYAITPEMLEAIVLATGSLAPFEALMGRTQCRVIRQNDNDALMLGKVDGLHRQISKLKRELARRVSEKVPGS